MNIGIISAGGKPGEYVQTNNELTESVTNFDRKRAGMPLQDWIADRYGIDSRSKTHNTPAELAAASAEDALRRAEMTASEIDLLVLNTTTGTHRQPTVATETQAILGMRRDSVAFELNMPCSGNIFGIATAHNFIKSGGFRNALVIGTDRMSDVIDQSEFRLAGMFGDGAGACVLSSNAKWVIEDTFLRSSNDERLVLELPNAVGNGLEDQRFLKMKGAETSRFIESALKEVVDHFLTTHKLKAHQIEQVVPHQASKTIVSRSLIELGFEKDQLSFSMKRYGNISSGAILFTLSEYLKVRHSGSGHIILVGMGGGLNWGGVLLRSNE